MQEKVMIMDYHRWDLNNLPIPSDETEALNHIGEEVHTLIASYFPSELVIYPKGRILEMIRKNKNIDPGFALDCGHVTELTLHYVKWSYIERYARLLKNLLVLRLMGNVDTMDLDLTYFPNLRVLNIDENLSISSLHESIEGLRSLEYLYARKCNLGTFPVAVTRLPRLRVLDISENELDWGDGRLKPTTERLETIEKDGTLPDSIGSMKSLEELHAWNCSIRGLPDSIGDIANLRVLDLSQNHIPSLPSSIGRLSKLEVLRLSGNPIGALPDSIGDMTNLRELSMGYCGLYNLPPNFARLHKLTSLYAANNCLTDLPPEILNYGMDIDLSDNRIADLSALRRGPVLGRFNFRGNPGVDGLRGGVVPIPPEGNGLLHEAEGRWNTDEYVSRF